MLSVLFFVLTSFSIRLAYFSSATVLIRIVIYATFIAGMLLVLCGVAFVSVEMYVSYRVILIEVKRLKGA